jgi:hypothetical protein
MDADEWKPEIGQRVQSFFTGVEYTVRGVHARYNGQVLVGYDVRVDGIGNGPCEIAWLRSSNFNPA